jgi:Domain of unknown function (DUF4105)
MMRRIFLSLVVLSFSAMGVIAQHLPDSSHLRVSLMTGGVADHEIWEAFGHTSIRIVDSVHHTDLAYNYGTFNGYDQNFELKFMRGKLLYFLDVYPYTDFVKEFTADNRGLQEQVLLLTADQKLALQDYLDEMALPQNRYYKYDFFFDNCCTRVRDIFLKIYGADFRYGHVLPQARLSFRDITNRYLYQPHWERVGINILLGSKVDKPMTDLDIMFLPDYLRNGIAGATVNGKQVAEPITAILQGAPMSPPPPNWPLILLSIVAVVTIIGLVVPAFRLVGEVMSRLLLFVSGLLGCIILFMWLGTDHQACRDNYNVLWALPTNLILAFGKPKGRGLYSLIAIGLLIMALLLNLFRIQVLPLPEMAPFFLTMLIVYGTIYKRSAVNKSGAGN